MKKKTFRVFDISWDANDNEKIDLPQSIKVTITEEDVDDLDDQEDIEFFIEDYISDETGFCHWGFQYEELESSTK